MTQIIKPYGKSWSDSWEWDGKILKPYGKSWAEGWEWDGKILKPYGKSWAEGWEWDGKIFKPYGKSWAESWEWDGKIFKPYGKSWAEGWEWDGKIFKPYGKSWAEGWEASANIPINVIAFVCIFATEESLDSVSDGIVAKSPRKNRNLAKSQKPKTSTRKRPKRTSPGEELGERLADFTIDLIVKIINYLKK